MVVDRICVIGSAPAANVETCMERLGEGVSSLLFLDKAETLANPELMKGCIRFSRRISRRDSAQYSSFANFAPTSVIIVCDKKYEHDDVARTVIAWSTQAGLKPRIFVYLHHILHGGYLETIRQMPEALALGSKR